MLLNVHAARNTELGQTFVHNKSASVHRTRKKKLLTRVNDLQLITAQTKS